MGFCYLASEQYITILADGKVAISALGSYDFKSKAVCDCLGKTNKLGKQKKIHR